MVGAFNPAIFSPDWLEYNNLIGRDDAEDARSCERFIVSQQATVYETKSFDLQVLEGQFSLTSRGALNPSLMDLAYGILMLVPQTPISGIGLNFLGHYKMASEQDYHKVGDTLAPKAIWNKLYENLQNNAGLTSLTIAIHDEERGKAQTTANVKRITVQPSGKVKNGIYFSINNHIDIHPPFGIGETAADRAAEIIKTKWQEGWDRSLIIFDKILEEALAS